MQPNLCWVKLWQIVVQFAKFAIFFVANVFHYAVYIQVLSANTAKIKTLDSDATVFFMVQDMVT